MDENSEFPKSLALENQNFKLTVCLQNIESSKFNGQTETKSDKLL